MKIYVLPYFGKLEAAYQVTGNNTVKLQSFVGNVPELFEFFFFMEIKNLSLHIENNSSSLCQTDTVS